MYTIILKELRKCKDLKDVYKRFKTLQKQFGLSFDQCRYLLHEYNNG